MCRLFQWQLVAMCEAVAYLLPIDKVAAVEQWDAGRILEAARDEVVIGVYAANARVGVEAGMIGFL